LLGKECKKMINQWQMSEFHMDALQEVANIGLGNAATSMAELLNKKVDMAVPKAFFHEFEQVFALVGGMEDLVSCVIIGIEGGIAAAVMFLFDEQNTYRLVDLLMGREAGSTAGLDAMGESVIMEVGNILAGSFLNAIGEMTGLALKATVPIFAFDMLGAILSSSLIASGCWDDKVLVVETVFSQKQDPVVGHFFLLPEIGSLGRLFETLGITLNS